MAMTVEELVSKVSFQSDEASRKKVASQANALRSTINKALGFIGITLSVAGLTRFGKQAVQAASDLEQMEQKFNTVFEGIQDKATSWAEKTADETGRATSTIKKYMADSQNLLVGFMGQENREAAMDMSEKMTSLAMDLASFANTDEAEAIQRMTKAVMGQAEAARGLGAVLNDVTRKQAMLDLGIQGTYDSLDQATRMQVNYQAILSQSLDAVGDCARSINTYESQNRQLNNRLLELKQTIGGYILPFASRLLKGINDLLTPFNRWLQGLGDLNDKGSRISRLLERFGRVVDNNVRRIRNIASRIKDFVDKIGGLSNALKLLGMIIAAIAIEKYASTFVNAFRGIIDVFKLFNIKGLIVIGIILLILLAIDDFIGFMQGRPSVLGDFLDAHDIDADEVRRKIVQVKDTIVKICEKIQEVFSDMHESIIGFFGITDEEKWQNFKDTLKSLFQIGGSSEPFGDELGSAQSTWERFKQSIEDNSTAIKDAWESLKNTVADYIQPVLDWLDKLFGGSSETESSGWLKWLQDQEGPDWLGWLSWLAEKLPDILGGIENAFKTAGDAVNGFMEAIQNPFWNNKSDNTSGGGGSHRFGEDNIIQIDPNEDFTTNMSSRNFKTLAEDIPDDAEDWGEDIIRNLGNGIGNMLGWLEEKVSAVADLFADYTKHSTPKRGAMKDDDKWTVHFMENLINGISSKEGALRGVINKVAGIMSGVDQNGLLSSGISPKVIGGAMNSNLTTVNQYNYFNNSFTGSDRQGQVQASQNMKRNAKDVTKEMAHAIGYGR